MRFLTRAFLLRIFILQCALLPCFCVDINGTDVESTKSSVSSTTITSTTVETTTSWAQRSRHDWIRLDRVLKDSINKLIKQNMADFIRSSSEIELTPACMGSFMKLIFGLRKLKAWSFKMLDAWGKPGGGIFQGMLTSFGSYDECVNLIVNEKRGGQEVEDFRGQYCLIDLDPVVPPRKLWITMFETLPELRNISDPDSIVTWMAKDAQFFHFMTLRLGACLPSTCTKEDARKIGQQIPNRLNLLINASIPHCETKEPVVLNGGQIAVISVLSVLGLFMAAGTLLDFLYIQLPSIKKYLSQDGIPARLLLSFSMYINTLKLFNTNVSSGSLTVMFGIRFLTLSWVMLCHSYLYIYLQGFRNQHRAKEYAKEFLFQFINNGFVGVDTFFFLSGVLIAYWRVQTKEKALNIPLYIIRRILRLSPSFMMITGITLLTPLLGSGPAWHVVLDPFVKNCENNWWTNLLFINNYVNNKNICLEHTWYLSTDIQLYIFFLIVLIPLAKFPISALVLNFVIMIAGVGLTFYINFINKFPPSILEVHPDPINRYEVATKMYFKPYCHAASYCIGIMTGYLLVTRPKMKFSRPFQIFAWSSSLALSMVLVFGVLESNKGNLPSPLVSSLYVSLSRPIWASCLAWVVIACTTGQGGIVHRFLSWSAFVPLSRLSFLLYLIHPVVQHVLAAFTHERQYLAHTTFIYFFLGTMTISIGLSYLATLTFEVPFMNMEKIVLPQKKPNPEALPSILNKEDITSNGLKNHTYKNGDAHPSNGTAQGVENGGYACRL